MLATTKNPKLEQKLASAGSQWKDDDLDEIMALLEKDYTKAQPKDDMDELKELLEKDYTKAEPEKAPHFPPLFGGGPIFREAGEEEEPASGEKAEEAVEETVITTLGEQADFSDAPAKPVERKFPLVAIAVAELVALVGVVIWFLQWSR